jgi:hypothetical protein
MKSTLQAAIILITLLPTYAQDRPATATTHLKQLSDGSNELTATALLLTYAGNVDGLLRDLVDQMRAISEQVEAGKLTPPDAEALKLETARVTIARLEAISAIYDVLILSKNDHEEPGSASPSDSPRVAYIALRAKPTVSVKQLMQENAQ